MPSAEKVEKVAVLKERIRGSQALLLSEFRGLSVHDATELRRSLGETGFSVVKNTLLKLAAGEAGIGDLGSAPNPLPQGEREAKDTHPRPPGRLHHVCTGGK